MSVEFLVGRAGSGKTHRCLNAIYSELSASAIEGPPLVLLVPEQASLQMERALVCDGPISATARAQVLSFRRLAVRILDAEGGLSGQPLSAAGRAMVLRAVVARLGKRLQYYRRVERMNGFFDRLGHTIGELIDENVSPDELRRIATTDANANSPHALKLCDLAAIYERYLTALGPDRVDPSRILELARKRLADSDVLSGAKLWVDGFAGFTEQERLLLTEWVARCQHAVVTLLIDPDYHSQAQSLEQIDSGDVFAPIQRSYLSLKRGFEKRDIAVASTGIRPAENLSRFAARSTLCRLETALASDPPLSIGAPPDAALPDQGALLIEAPDRRAEVAYAVGEILEAVRCDRDPLRYRDIAIVTRDLSIYHDLIAAALDQYDIPYFVDRRQPAGHHPLVEFIRGCVNLAANDFALHDVRLLLKTGLLAPGPVLSDELENYLLAFGIEGAEKWTTQPWRYRSRRSARPRKEPHEDVGLERINRARTMLLDQLDGFLTYAQDAHSANRWADALKTLVESHWVTGRIERWAQRAEADGRIHLADTHRQVVDLVMELIDDLAFGLDDTSLDARRLSAVLDAGFSQMTLGLTPPTVDQILVGSIDRSRNPSLRRVIVLGLNEGVFPKRWESDSLLSDDDRARFDAEFSTIGASSRRRILEERLLLYIAATRASERVTFCYAACSDGASRELTPSHYVAALRSALPELKLKVLEETSNSPSLDSVYDVNDLAKAITIRMRRRPPLAQDDPVERTRWNDLYRVARTHEQARGALSHSTAALAYSNDAALDHHAAASLFCGTYRASVSELETFATCPFKRFAQYGLRLRERDVASMDSRNMGTVDHEVLERLVGDIIGRSENVASLHDTEIIARLERAAEQVGAIRTESGQPATARDAHWIKRSASRLAPAIRQQLRAFRCGAFQPIAVEAAFGFERIEGSLAPLTVNTPKGRVALLRGYIDRIDAAQTPQGAFGVVIDYKSSDKKLEMDRAFYGLSLQLPAYLLAMRNGASKITDTPIQPVGALYVTLRRGYVSVEHPNLFNAEPGAIKARGILDAAALHLFENIPSGQWSEHFNVFRKKDGSLGRRDTSDAIVSSDLQSILQFVERKLGQICDAVLDGDVRVAPYRLRTESPCTHCPYKSVCRFEITDGNARYLPTMSQADAIKSIKAVVE